MPNDAERCDPTAGDAVLIKQSPKPRGCPFMALLVLASLTALALLLGGVFA